MSSSYVLIIFLLILLGVVPLLFFLVDRSLKGGSAKPAEKKAESPKAVVEKPAEPVKAAEVKPAVTMKIYNSELADDLNKMLEETDTNQSSRIQIENHTNKESNISKYITEKKYHGFDFGADGEGIIDDTESEQFTFNREDYKKFMALSNIDDNKPL